MSKYPNQSPNLGDFPRCGFGPVVGRSDKRHRERLAKRIETVARPPSIAFLEAYSSATQEQRSIIEAVLDGKYGSLLEDVEYWVYVDVRVSGEVSEEAKDE